MNITYTYIKKTCNKLVIMQKPITENFEFFEFAHAIAANNINFIIKLWLTGNKEMQYLLEKYLKSLNDKNFHYGLLYKKRKIMSLKKKQKLILLKKFPNVEYIKFTFNNRKTTDFIKYIPKSIKVLYLENYKIQDSEINSLPENLIDLKINAKKLTSASVLSQKLINCDLSDCQNLANKFFENILENVTILYLDNLSIVEFKFKPLENLNLLGLSLSNGNIKTFIVENCPNLQILYIYRQQLEHFPESILEFTNLKKLNLYNNKIIHIPNEISQLQNLNQLNLSKNEIVEISPAILELSNLEMLDLSHNHISKVFILNSKLQNLKTLQLNYNQIAEIYLELPKLEIFNIIENPIIQGNFDIPRRTLIDVLSIFQNIINRWNIHGRNFPNINNIQSVQNVINIINSNLSLPRLTMKTITNTILKK